MQSIDINIPKDIREYESKLIGPFSTRKVICLAIGGALSYGAFFLQKTIMGMENPNPGICIFSTAPAMMFLAKPYGLKMEEFLKTAFIENYLSPRNKPYKTENTIAEYFGFDDDTELSVQLEELEIIHKSKLENENLSKKERNLLIKQYEKEKAKIKKQIIKENKITSPKNIPKELKAYQ